MSSIYEIKARIKSVESTEKMTKTMKLVSTSKMHQTQSRLYKIEGFAEKCRQAMGMVVSDISGEECPLMAKREIQKTCYVLFVGNRGLCGAYNTDVVKYLYSLTAREEKEYCTVICGRWSGEYGQAKKLNVLRLFGDMEDVPSQEKTTELSAFLKELYISGQADRIVLVYQKRAALSQRPRQLQLLPIEATEEGAAGEFIFEPDKLSLVNTITSMYVDSTVATTLLEAKVSEHFARMTAMTNAIDNADELLHELNLTLNRTRQAKITTEISEIVGGANALRNGE